MSNVYFYSLCCVCAVFVAYVRLFPSSEVNHSDDEAQIEVSNLQMIDLCESMSHLYQNGMFSDLTLVAEDEFKVHKCVLSARSEVFRQMIESKKELDKIVIDGISREAMSQMLFFIYTGHTEDFSVEVAVELFKAADKYKLDLLKKLCSDILVKNLNSNNSLEFLLLVSNHTDENLQKASIEFLVGNILEIREQSKWMEFIETHPKIIDDAIVSLASKK